MFEKEEIEYILRRLIGEELKIRIKSPYTACIVKFKLHNFSFSSGGHRSNVSNSIIKDNNIYLHDKDSNIVFQFEYKDIESIEKDKREKCELNLIYRDGTNVTIYKDFNF
ncbi:hypothetical protein FDB40_17230 [Clostridium botulinum]|nr:hypothetical protein [Clostridium botulinum]